MTSTISKTGSNRLIGPRIASTFVLVLNWWVENESPLPAREADALFRRLVEPSLGELLG